MYVQALDDSTDVRGLSFSILGDHLSEIGPARDIHIGEIRPGCIRGNHYHVSRGELIGVIYSDQWSLHWDTGPDTIVNSKHFSGTGAVAVVPPRNWSHAVRNDGVNSVWIVAVSDKPYDRHETDPVRRDAIARTVAT
jgi:hypothetical protein